MEDFQEDLHDIAYEETTKKVQIPKNNNNEEISINYIWMVKHGTK